MIREHVQGGVRLVKDAVTTGWHLFVGRIHVGYVQTFKDARQLAKLYAPTKRRK